VNRIGTFEPDDRFFAVVCYQFCLVERREMVVMQRDLDPTYLVLSRPLDFGDVGRDLSCDFVSLDRLLWMMAENFEYSTAASIREESERSGYPLLVDPIRCWGSIVGG
jgi:hypothetical protein